MNSKQRRKFQRKWKHCIVLRDCSHVEAQERIAWAHEHFGYHKYQPHWVPGVGHAVLFDDSKKALLFALVWS